MEPRCLKMLFYTLKWWSIWCRGHENKRSIFWSLHISKFMMFKLVFFHESEIGYISWGNLYLVLTLCAVVVLDLADQPAHIHHVTEILRWRAVRNHEASRAGQHSHFLPCRGARCLLSSVRHVLNFASQQSLHLSLSDLRRFLHNHLKSLGAYLCFLMVRKITRDL